MRLIRLPFFDTLKYFLVKDYNSERQFFLNEVKFYKKLEADYGESNSSLAQTV